MRRPHRSPRLATLCLQGDTTNSTKGNAGRITILGEVIARLCDQPDWHPLDAILLPGGYFHLSRTLGTRPFEQRKRRIESERFAMAIRENLRRLQTLSPKVRVVLGVLATPRNKADRTEQACLAFDTTGVIGIARKMFPTSAEMSGRRYMSPCVDDFSARERFIDLPNGSRALLNSCYDMFGTADALSSSHTRRLAIRAIRQGSERLTHRDRDFRSIRDNALSAWNSLLAQQQPDVLLASIHALARPGLDGYWQRHGIARASAALRGAFALGAAHFLDELPNEGSTLAAAGVPKSALSAGVCRRAHRLAPRRVLGWATNGGTPVLLRLFEPPAPKSSVAGR